MLIARARPPVSLLTKSTLRQIVPPSVVLKMPRSWFGPNGDPRAASHATSGFAGCTFTAPICPESFSPANLHVRPASMDLYTPRPMITLLRIAALPVPT